MGLWPCDHWLGAYRYRRDWEDGPDSLVPLTGPTPGTFQRSIRFEVALSAWRVNYLYGSNRLFFPTRGGLNTCTPSVGPRPKLQGKEFHLSLSDSVVMVSVSYLGTWYPTSDYMGKIMQVRTRNLVYVIILYDKRPQVISEGSRWLAAPYLNSLIFGWRPLEQPTHNHLQMLR